MYPDRGGYVQFDNFDDTLADAWEHAGYEYFEDAAKAMGGQDLYDSDGNWLYGDVKSEGEALFGLTLKPSKERRDDYIAKNYPSIAEAEDYQSLARELEDSGSPGGLSEFGSNVLNQVIGDVIGKVSGALSLFYGLATNTVKTGVDGVQKMINDVKGNKSILLNLQIKEAFPGPEFLSSFDTRTDEYRKTSGQLSFPSKPYLSD